MKKIKQQYYRKVIIQNIRFRRLKVKVNGTNKPNTEIWPGETASSLCTANGTSPYILVYFRFDRVDAPLFDFDPFFFGSFLRAPFFEGFDGFEFR